MIYECLGLCFGRKLREEAEKRKSKPKKETFEVKDEKLTWMSRVQEASFDFEKSKVFKEVCPPRVTCNQMAIALKQFDFSKTRYDVLKEMRERLIDPENYKVISSNQIFSSERKEMDRLLKEEIQRRRFLGIN